MNSPFNVLVTGTASVRVVAVMRPPTWKASRCYNVPNAVWARPRLKAAIGAWLRVRTDQPPAQHLVLRSVKHELKGFSMPTSVWFVLIFEITVMSVV
jgi:hypothetical protein